MANPTLAEAFGYWQRGNPEAAAAVSSRLVAEDPADVDAVVFHSGLLLHLGRYDEAKGLLTETQVHHPDHASLLANLSIAERNCGEELQAVATAEHALVHAPELLAAWNALVVALLAAGKPDEAREQLRKALALHPQAPSLQHLETKLADPAQAPSRKPPRSVANDLVGQARQLVAAGALGRAESTYRQALSIDPDHAQARIGLGELLMLAGRAEEAASQLAAALRITPSDARARHLFAVASGNAPPVASRQYVRELFDGMAETFDVHLQERLAYRIPEQMAAYLEEFAGEDLGEVLDLGCGTGLVGERLQGHCQAIDGVDLSARMLLLARAKDCYRQLHLSEIGDFLQETESRWQTVTAADVLIYHGRVDDLFLQIKRVLLPGGCFCFSVEAASGEGFDVDPTSGRFRHSRTCLESALQTAGLSEHRFIEATIRNESGRPIPGWIVLAR